jgi:hypothetical protein
MCYYTVLKEHPVKEGAVAVITDPTKIRFASAPCRTECSWRYFQCKKLNFHCNSIESLIRRVAENWRISNSELSDMKLSYKEFAYQRGPTVSKTNTSEPAICICPDSLHFLTPIISKRVPLLWGPSKRFLLEISAFSSCFCYRSYI